MAKSRQRSKSPLASITSLLSGGKTRRPSGSKKRPKVPRWRNSVLNSVIGILSVLLVAFIFSFSQKNTQSGVSIDVQFPEPEGQQPTLAVDIYEENPVLDIEVEVLNGCGTAGIAGKISDFLRNQRVDVVRSENADHFNYSRTQIIQRNENFEGLQHVATALGFDISNAKRVKVEPRAGSDVDLTLIIGQDFESIDALSTYLRSAY